MADAFWPPAGPVSATNAAPLGAKVTEKAPGPALAFITIGDRVPLLCTLNASISLVSRSVTRRNVPFGLKANEAAPEVLVLRKVRELAIERSLPFLSTSKPAELLLHPVLRTTPR